MLSLVSAMGNVIPSTNIAITGMSRTPATTVFVECRANAGCTSAVNGLFNQIRAGNVQLIYYVIYGTFPCNQAAPCDPANIVRNPVKAFTFPLWAIGLIIGGIGILALGALLLCVFCSKGRKR